MELFNIEKTKNIDLNNITDFEKDFNFKYLETIIGSGYEDKISTLALEDKVAYRAARKNMQIHSAIIIERKLDNDFVGFFTFQVNDEAKEFCLLQSALKPIYKNKQLYSELIRQMLKYNKNNYPAIITVGRKSELETPEVFENLGFITYIEKSGFCYMVHNGDINGKEVKGVDYVRKKLLAHITMTNVWKAEGGEWLKQKQAWNEKIEKAGEKYEVKNPKFASREGCWQGESGFSNVVTGKSLNGNASVLDPLACECCLRLFMPKDGKRVYNPFGGGVQFGFVSGDCGYEYIASEIRQNQCDANNKICNDYKNVKWIQSDSSKFEPEGMFDMVFTCPPYYKVERYVDYDGNPPEGEINAFNSYEEFREALFKGYSNAIKHLKDNCFFIAMVGDSRGPDGAYWGMEAETELFLKQQGLHLYNKIVYVESGFTRHAQAKKTLNYRKFPKQEQKIIVAYKGDMSKIKELYEPIGRL